MDAVTRVLPAGFRKILALFVCLTIIAYGLLMMIGGWQLMDIYSTLNLDAEDLPVPMWLVLSVLPIGAALILFRTVEVGVQVFKGQRLGFSTPTDESADSLEAHHRPDDGVSE